MGSPIEIKYQPGTYVNGSLFADMIRAIKTHTHFIGVMRYYRERLVRTPPRTGPRTNEQMVWIGRDHALEMETLKCERWIYRYQPASSKIEKFTDLHPIHTTVFNEKFMWQTTRNQFTYWRSRYRRKKKKIVISTSFVRILIVEFSTHFPRNGNRSHWPTWNFNLTYRKFAADPIVCHHVCAVRYFTNSLDRWWYWPLLGAHRVRWAWKIGFFSFPMFKLAPAENITILYNCIIMYVDKRRASMSIDDELAQR